ncbi:MAG: bile acid:sodium symporter family protein [Bacteroidota bacterium]
MLNKIAYSLIIILAVIVAMMFPAPFVSWGSFSTKSLIVPLLQIIMFGMGTAMSLQDFKGVIKMPKGVLVGMVCQFSIMPLIGFLLTKAFSFEAGIAAGIILVGASPSGLASNVMTYLSRGNLALSVSMTACATLLAPFLTPFLMQSLAGELIPIDFWAMMWSITRIVIIPIVLGLVFNHFFHGRFSWLDRAMPLVSMAGIAFIIVVITANGRDSLLQIGGWLILSCIIHNGLGYLFGYWGCRLLRLPEEDCRTIALEVGMQNSGLASGIAAELGRIATLGLAPAIFGPLMNITGSSLAMWWRGQKMESANA